MVLDVGRGRSWLGPSVVDVDDAESLASGSDVECEILLRLRVEDEETAAGFLGGLGVTIPVAVCTAVGGYDSDVDLSSFDEYVTELRSPLLLLLLLPEGKMAETTRAAKAPADEMI